MKTNVAFTVLAAFVAFAGIANAQSSLWGTDVRLIPQSSAPVSLSGNGVGFWSNSSNSNHPTLHVGGVDYDVLYTLGGLSFSTSVPSNGYGVFFNNGTSTWTPRLLQYSDLSTPGLVGAIASTVMPGNDERVGLDAVAQYGASTGSSDNSTALINCLAGAHSDTTRRTCQLPAGTFQIAATVTIPSGVTLLGAGIGQTIIAYTPSTGTALTFGSGGSSIVRQIEIRATNALYSGTLVTAAQNTLLFDTVGFRCLSGSGTCTGAAALLDLTNSVNVTLSGRGFFWGAQSCLVGVNAGGGFSNVVTVTGQVFNYCEQYAIFQPELNWLISNCTFEPTTLGYPSGIYSTAVVAEGLKIMANYFSDASAAHAGNNWIDLLCGSCDISGGNLFNNGNNSAYPQTQVSSIIFEAGSRGIAFKGNRVLGGEDIVVTSQCSAIGIAGLTSSNAWDLDFSGNYMINLTSGAATPPPASCTSSVLWDYTVNANTINTNTLTVATAFSPSGTVSTLGNLSIRGLLTEDQTLVNDVNFTSVGGVNGSGNVPTTTAAWSAITAPRTFTMTLSQGGNSTAPRWVYVWDQSGAASLTNPIKGIGSSGLNNGSAAAMNLVTAAYGGNFMICDGTNCFSPQWLSMNDVRVLPAPSGAGKVVVDTGSAYAESATPTVTAIVSTGSTFASLGTPTNGTFQYCSDCTIANPCASGGTGALAKRLNGVWVCN